MKRKSFLKKLGIGTLATLIVPQALIEDVKANEKINNKLIQSIWDVPKDMVLIIQNNPSIIYDGKELVMYKPSIGFIDKNFWECIKEFQSIKIKNLEMDKLLCKAMKNEFITDEEYFKYPEIKQWQNLVLKFNLYWSTVLEFNLLVFKDKNGKEEWHRQSCLLGKEEWKLVEG